MDLRETPSSHFSRHPWETARYRFFRGVLEQGAIPCGPLQVLDVGAGDAWFSSELIRSLPSGSRCACWDIGYASPMALAAFDDDRLLPVVSQPRERFDLVLLLDVAEHVEDDAGFVREIVDRNVEAGAWVLFSVPAWDALSSSHDVALGHFRRYQPQQARELLQKSGLEIVRSGGLFHSLLIPRALEVLRERVAGRSETLEQPELVWRHGALLERIVGLALSGDGLLSRWTSMAGLQLPGLSWWALCRK